MKINDLNDFPKLSFNDWVEVVKKENPDSDPLQRLTKLSIDEVEYAPLITKLNKFLVLQSSPSQSKLVEVDTDTSLGFFCPIEIWNKSDLSLEKIIIENAQQTKIKIETDIIHNAGSSCIDELILALSVAMQYPDKFINFVVAVGCEQYLSIAKLRALRYLWERFCEENQLPLNFEITTISSLREFTLFDAWNNEIRNTCSVSAAFIGGADNIIIYPHDELISRFNKSKRNPNSVRLAENVFHILKEESFLDKVIDPIKGSFAVEDLTIQIIEGVSAKLIQHEKDNYNIYWLDLPKEVSQSAEKRFEKLRSLKNILTGINSYTNPSEKFLSADKLKYMEDPIGKFPLKRLAQEFENLRIGFEQISPEFNGIILCHGNRSLLSARINFCKNIFEISGIEMQEVFLEDKDLHSKISSSQVVVLCALDNEYDQLLAESVRISKFTSNIYIAGKLSPEQFASYPIRSAVYRGQDILEVLSVLLMEMRA